MSFLLAGVASLAASFLVGLALPNARLGRSWLKVTWSTLVFGALLIFTLQREITSSMGDAALSAETAALIVPALIGSLAGTAMARSMLGYR